ncbi:unnamed protein product [Brassica rapa subsp. narinosa]
MWWQLRSRTPSRSFWSCRSDKRYFRPTEVDNLKGDASKAKEVLKWKPKVGFE